MVANIDEAKNLAYILDRREHTAAMLVQTNPPVQEPVVNVEGETPIQARAEASMQHLWNGA